MRDGFLHCGLLDVKITVYIRNAQVPGYTFYQGDYYLAEVLHNTDLPLLASMIRTGAPGCAYFLRINQSS